MRRVLVRLCVVVVVVLGMMGVLGSPGVPALAADPTPPPTPTPVGPFSIWMTVLARPEFCTSDWSAQRSAILPSIPADDSITQGICIWVMGSNGVGVANQPVIMRAKVGEFGMYAGSPQQDSVITDIKGKAAIRYHGAGRVAATETITASIPAMALEVPMTLTLTASQATATPTPVETATPAPTPVATATAVSSTAGRIVGGAAPLAGGGFTLFVFGGGTNDQLVSASLCAASRVVFWVSAPDGSFITLVPGATVAVVNESWNLRFTTGVPVNTPVIATCRAS